MTNTFVFGSADIAAEEFDGEYVVLDVGSGRYFSLASGTALIWRGLAEGYPIEALCADLEASSPIREQIESVVSQFIDYGLLKPAPREPVAGPAPLGKSISSQGLTFELDVFNDLADLLVSDPVHDVDEGAGWPHRPTN